jgi:putative ABC transport system permease protein
MTRALFGLPGVASVEPVAAGTTALRDYIDEFTIIIQIAAFIVMLLALLIAFNSTAINAEERAREHATMFAFGLPVHTVLRMAIVESLLKGLLATLLGVAGGLVLIGWVFYAFLPEVLPELGGTITLTRATYSAAALVGVVASAVAPLLTVRRLRRMDVPSTLRIME